MLRLIAASTLAFVADVVRADPCAQAGSHCTPIAAGVLMPKVNLGTCCGSQPKVGLRPWIEAGGRGIDTAYDYGKLVPGGRESDIRAVLETHPKGLSRPDFFITTKIPAGYGIAPASCTGGPAEALKQVKDNLQQLGVDRVDLVLLHHPCKTDKDNLGLWRGLEEAVSMNLTRTIGVSNYKEKDLKPLLAQARIMPAVNQCEMSVASFDAATIAYSQSVNITYEAFNAMKGCPFTSPAMAKIVSEVNAGGSAQVGPAQICLRWVLQRGCVLAVGTGANATTATEYAKEDLELFGFELTKAQMETLNSIGDSSVH
eukprot:COSAG05_NODE_117_length_17936_cov_137.220945_2_plen_314_part_00